MLAIFSVSGTNENRPGWKLFLPATAKHFAAPVKKHNSKSLIHFNSGQNQWEKHTAALYSTVELIEDWEVSWFAKGAIYIINSQYKLKQSILIFGEMIDLNDIGENLNCSDWGNIANLLWKWPLGIFHLVKFFDWLLKSWLYYLEIIFGYCLTGMGFPDFP